MTKLLQHIEDMRARLGEIGTDEKALVKALGDALSLLDQQLLSEVRTIATEHEVRREAILSELQSLAAGIGMFRAPMQNNAVTEEQQPTYVTSQTHRQAISPGDWRQATSNIEDEYDHGLNGRGSPH